MLVTARSCRARWCAARTLIHHLRSLWQWLSSIGTETDDVLVKSKIERRSEPEPDPSAQLQGKMVCRKKAYLPSEKVVACHLLKLELMMCL